MIGNPKAGILKKYYIWYGIVASILTVMGMIFSIFGFGIFPDKILPHNVLLTWESSIYGAVLIGLGVMIFLLGRLAFRRKDPELMKIIIMGLGIWLAIEALFSVYLGVYFNAGVDVAVFVLFYIPAYKIIKYLKQHNDKGQGKS